MPTRQHWTLHIRDDFWYTLEVADAFTQRDVAALLRLVQRATGANQAQLAVSIGLTQPRISAIIRGVPPKTIDVLTRITHGLKMPQHVAAAFLLAQQPTRPEAGPTRQVEGEMVNGPLDHLISKRERQEDRQPGPSDADGGAEETETLEPFGEMANRLWRLGEPGAEAAISIMDAGIADLVERYETEDPATLAPLAVTLRRSFESMVRAEVSASQRQRFLGLAGRATALLAYMAVNLGRFAHADAYGLEAFVLAREAGDRGLMAWVRGTQSFASYYRGDYRNAVEYARDGLRVAGTGPQALRLKINCEARALAFLPGFQREAKHAVAQAYQLADRLDVAEGISSCISFDAYSRGRVIANAITVFQTLGESDEAISLIQEVEPMVQTSNSAWSQSLIGLDHASALLYGSDPDVEKAMHLACAALTASADRPITSVMQRSQALALSITQYSSLPSVREFRELLHEVASVSPMASRTPITYARKHDSFDPASVSAKHARIPDRSGGDRA